MHTEVFKGPARTEVTPPSLDPATQNEKIALITARSIRAIEIQLDRLELYQTAVKGMSWDKRAECAKEAAGLAKATAQLVDSIRKREQAARELVLNMTAGERDALIQAYIQALPLERREALKEWLGTLAEEELLK